MRWLQSVTNGEAKLYKVFWPGLIGFAVVNILYLRVMGVAVVYDENLFASPLLAEKSTLELLLPALLLAGSGLLLGLYTTLASAGIWQAADRYPGKWPLWPNLAFFLVMLGDVFVVAESLVGISYVFSTFSKVLTGGAA